MRWVKYSAAGVIGIIVVFVLIAYLLLRGSLPQLDGKITNATLSAPATITRDVIGVVTITAANRLDLAFATGYAHGQDRLFQMDLQRRLAAGELSELLGKELIDLDKRFRRHDFRHVAREVIARATPEQKKLIDTYVLGVNAAREAMRVKPFEYLLLGQQPAPWTAEDCLLIAYSMYIDLNDSDGAHELERARLHSALPPQVYALLYPFGTEWDAPIDGVDLANAHAPLPGPDVINLKSERPGTSSERVSADDDFPGSNNWAVAGNRSAGGALVANDMHLSFRIPHIWYRARLIVKSDAGVSRDLAGVTLPGLPLLVAGSNGHIAWGFTNTHGNYDDLVLVDVDKEQSNRYRTVDGYVDFKSRHEQIKVRGASPIDVEYKDTIWGPLLDEQLDKPVALAWTAQRPEATNLNQMALEGATSVKEAIEIANTSGIPVQNFTVADADGHIGWTPIGQLPKRVGFDGTLPACWGCAPNVGWAGWVAPSDYPRVIDPPNGQLWSANSRTLGGAGAEMIGDEDMDRGARTKQIRDDLLALNRATPGDMLKIQLDDRALFLMRWRNVLLSLLNQENLRNHPARGAIFDKVNRWSGRASIDDAGYRIVRGFRAAVQEDIYNSLIAPAKKRFPDAKFRPSTRFEDTVWRIMTTQPDNLLDPKFTSWNARILASLDRSLELLGKECDVKPTELARCTWGKRNTLKMEHPLASALPLLGALLRMPSDELPGDQDMPRVQGVSFGQSERFAVSPGHEAEGYFNMPGGQSGHPLSPYFKAGHESWAKGERTPFLPGAAEHTLELSPRN